MSAESEYICCMCYKPIDAHTHNGEVYWTSGHNAQPLVAANKTHPSMVEHGRCCDSCNGIVVQVRMMQAFGHHETAGLIIGMFRTAKTQTDAILAHMKVLSALMAVNE